MYVAVSSKTKPRPRYGASTRWSHAGQAWPGCHPPMLLMDGEGDMLLIDGEGDEPLPDEGADGISMFMGAPPMPMLWWTATHQFHTSVCIGPATYPIRWPSSWVQTMYSRPWP